MTDTLVAIPQRATRVSKRKWFRLIDTLCSDIPEIAGEEGVFSWTKKALNIYGGRRVVVTDQVHEKLNLWHHFIESLGKRPTHLRDIQLNTMPYKG